MSINFMIDDDLAVVDGKVTFIEGLVCPESVFPDITPVKYYKTVAVDTASKTWSGFEATIIDGKYVFASTPTTGLRYGYFVPVVGEIYDSTTSVHISRVFTGIPQEGLIFELPLKNNIAPTVGNSISQVGFLSFQEYQGKRCAYFDGLSGIRTPSLLARVGNNFTMSCFIKTTVLPSENFLSEYTDNSVNFSASFNVLEAFGSSVRDVDGSYVTPGECGGFTSADWHFFAFGCRDGKWFCRQDDRYFELNDTQYTSIYENADNTFSLGIGSNEIGFQGYITCFRVWNRALENDELSILSQE